MKNSHIARGKPVIIPEGYFGAGHKGIVNKVCSFDEVHFAEILLPGFGLETVVQVPINRLKIHSNSVKEKIRKK